MAQMGKVCMLHVRRKLRLIDGQTSRPQRASPSHSFSEAVRGFAASETAVHASFECWPRMRKHAAFPETLDFR